MSEKVFFIADTHFGDERIRRYENRPFQSVEEMNEALIHNWNACVDDSDYVYVLGDFAEAGLEKDILGRLKGRKYLVKGNHDVNTDDYYRKAGFEKVYDKPIILNDFWILSHEPLYVNENMPYANIFGHVHNSPQYKSFSKQHYCVSVERIEYCPIDFECIKRKIQEL